MVYMQAVEQLREKVINELMALSTMKRVWPNWGPTIGTILGPNTSYKDLIDLGTKLKDIFSSTSSGRTQSSVSGGGAAWEALVCWYLNLCLVGSRTVIIKAKKDNIPKSISDAISVMYHTTFKSNTESDLLAITLPDDPKLHSSFTSHNALMEALDNCISKNFNKTSLTIIQCKTNWNDNAQIPMLWDLIYSAKGFSQNVTVGSNGFSPSGLKMFRYGFVTVPTSRGPYNSHSTSVMRVRNLTGGNYWGQPSKSAVAANIFDMVQKNFSESFNGYQNGWHSAIANEIAGVRCSNNYFKLQ
jgi:hypothetical protein